MIYHLHDNKKEFSFFLYDYETFGLSPSLDKPAQFAGLRTNFDFKPIEEEKVFYCFPPSDYLPNPKSVIITGITPKFTKRYGITEANFAKQIYKLFTKKNTCILGYNNLYFDDEITRNIFYRNFYDSYSWSWKNGNSRWDLLQVMRAYYALRPNGIIWPKNNGLTSFRLSELTKANNILHKHSHNALSDIHATLALAKLAKKKQPKLFKFLFFYRKKKKIIELIDIKNINVLVYVSKVFGIERSNTSLIAPITWHPKNNNILIAIDLANDISTLIKLNNDELYDLFNKKDKFQFSIQHSIQLIYTNRCPILAPITVLHKEDLLRLKINITQCLNNLAIIRKCKNLQKKITNLFLKQKYFLYSDDIDTQLYKSFFDDRDRKNMNKLLENSPRNISTLNLSFNDERIKNLLFRYRARNFPETLNSIEKLDWFKHCQKKLTKEKIQKFLLELKLLANLHKEDKKKLKQLKSLYLHLQELISQNYINFSE